MQTDRRLAELERLAYDDALTEIGNRRRFDDALAREWARCARDATPLSLILADIDYFKIFNDTYGHQAGDVCLRSVARALAEIVQRPSDTLARYGGEEFVALLPSTSADGARLVAERFRERVASAELAHAGSSIGNVTLSIGIATIVPTPAARAEDLIREADDALYRAKRAGRNRAVSAEYESDAPPAERAIANAAHNLPLQATRLIGRDADVGHIAEALESNRLVTIVAFGGTGKTRTALKVASEALGRFEDGVWFVDLSTIAEGSSVASTIANIFGLRLSGAEPAAALASALKTKRTLIVLDNCEHVVEAAALACIPLLRECAGIRILATSRQDLRVDGETVYRLAPLSAGAATELFVDRARAARRDFVATGPNAELIAAICGRLEGLALSIELAAARLEVFGLEELDDRLAQRLSVLRGGSRESTARQQTLRALIDWSYALLSEPERRMFRSLSVFSGGWTLDAAAHVGASHDDTDPFELMAALANKSMVVVEFVDAGSRYRLLDSLGEYAREKLDESGAGDAVHAAHAAYYLRLARQADGEYWIAPYDALLRDQRSELDNFRAALTWTLTEAHDLPTGAALAGSLMRFWFFLHDEGRQWGERALHALPPNADPEIEARLYLGLAQSDMLPAAQARDFAERSLAHYRTTGNRERMADALYYLAMTISLYFPAERAAGEALATEALAIARALGAPRLRLMALRARAQSLDPGDVPARRADLVEALDLCRVHGRNDRLLSSLMMSRSELEFEADDYAAAARYGAEALDAARSAGTSRAIALSLCNVAHYAVAMGDWQTAQSTAEEAIGLSVQSEDEYMLTVALHALAAAFGGRGWDERSAKLFGCCNARFGTLHPPRQEGSCEETVYRRTRDALEHRLGIARLERLMDAGAGLGSEGAVGEALAAP